MSRAWNPWRALRERPWLRLVFAPLPSSTGGGALLEVDGHRYVVIEEALRQRDRNATLAHELVHDERGILFTADTPEQLVVKEEAAVRRTTARRLVPVDELVDLVERLVDMGEAVSALEVEEEFDVPADVALLALWLLAAAEHDRDGGHEMKRGGSAGERPADRELQDLIDNHLSSNEDSGPARSPWSSYRRRLD